MKYTNYIKTLLLITLTAGVLTSGGYYKAIAENATVKKPVSQQVQTAQGIFVKPLTLINSPKTYLNKSIIMEAKFDKFSTLGLDYKPAFKSSDDYISFLIKRDDTNFDIPLSEMKLFIKRDMAEKFIDLKTNDEIEIKGIVFADALGDTWVDVKELKVTKKAPDEKNKK